jgi:hypothetical protein
VTVERQHGRREDQSTVTSHAAYPHPADAAQDPGLRRCHSASGCCSNRPGPGHAPGDAAGGLRCCKVWGLQLADIHLADRRLTITEVKGGHHPIVPVAPGFFAALTDYLNDERPSETSTGSTFRPQRSASGTAAVRRRCQASSGSTAPGSPAKSRPKPDTRSRTTPEHNEQPANPYRGPTVNPATSSPATGMSQSTSASSQAPLPDRSTRCRHVRADPPVYYFARVLHQQFAAKSNRDA